MPTHLPMSGRQLAEIAIRDFQSFFEPKAGFKLQAKFGGPVSRGVRKELRGSIVLPADFETASVEDSDDLHFSLLVVGREIARLVHLYDTRGQLENASDRGLEDWADYYGAKVMLALVTYGPEIHPVYEALEDPASFDGRIESMGRAIERLAKGVGTDTAGGSAPLARAGLTAVGIASFIDTDFGDFVVGRTARIFRCILSSDELRRLVAEEEAKEDSVDVSSDFHKAGQVVGRQVVPGMDEEIAPYLGTAFTVDDDTLAALREVRRVMVAGGLP